MKYTGFIGSVWRIISARKLSRSCLNRSVYLRGLRLEPLESRTLLNRSARLILPSGPTLMVNPVTHLAPYSMVPVQHPRARSFGRLRCSCQF